jgi:hypothetical protein
VGTPAYDRAAQWAAAKLRAAGLTNVRLEEFTLPNGWQRESARARIVSPIARSLHVESVGWGPSTPSGGVRGDLILVSDVSPDALRSQAAQLKHRIVIIDVERAVPPTTSGFAHLRASYALFSTLAFERFCFPMTFPTTSLGFWTPAMRAGRYFRFQWEKSVGKIICFSSVTLRAGRVIVDLEWHNKVSGPKRVSNVIAEIPGGTLPPRVGDSRRAPRFVDLGTGAQDNGTGVVMVLEAARAIAALGKSPRRTIRFALWAAEEPGPPGSAMIHPETRSRAAGLRRCPEYRFRRRDPPRMACPRPRGCSRSNAPNREQLSDLGADSLSMYLNCGLTSVRLSSRAFPP